MKLYQIVHLYDLEGDLGTCYSDSKVIATVVSKSNAEKYVKKWSKPVIAFNRSFEFWHGTLIVREIEVQDELDLNVDLIPNNRFSFPDKDE